MYWEFKTLFKDIPLLFELNLQNEVFCFMDTSMILNTTIVPPSEIETTTKSHKKCRYLVECHQVDIVG